MNLADKPVLSIIVPVYNVERYLHDCLNSLISQNVDKTRYEIICVDDGSTDTSGEILDQFAESNSCIKVIHKENGGVSSARNTGIDAAEGRYIWFVDSDDFVARDCLVYIFKAIDKHSPELIRFFYKHVEESSSFETMCPDSIHNVQGKLYKGRTSGLNVCCIVATDIIRSNNIRFSNNMKYGEDIMFMYYVYVYSQGSHWTLFNNYFYFYRARNSSAMNTRTTEIYTRRTRDLLYMSKVYSDAYENRITDNPEVLENTKQRQHLALLGALTILPRASFNYKDTMKTLKKEKLYPFPWMWWHVKKSRNKKAKIVEGCKLFFKFEFIYRIYYLIMRKK